MRIPYIEVIGERGKRHFVYANLLICDYEYEFDYEYDFLETFRFDYEFDYEYDFL